MPAKKRLTPLETGKEQLKWDTARELGLDDDLEAGGDELTTKEAGKIGGHIVKKLVEKGKEELTEEEQPME